MKKGRYQRGTSLIEILLVIAILSGAIAVFGALFNTTKLNRVGSLYTRAYKIAQEEMEAVRALPISALTVKENDHFWNILHNDGAIGATDETAAVSSPNVLKNNSSASSTMGFVVAAPGYYSNFVFEASLKTASTTAKTGLIFRARDIDNYYFLYLKNNHLVLEKNINGAATVLRSSVQTYNPDIWYKLKVDAAGENISIYLNDNIITTASDNSFAAGLLALANESSVAYFDNARLVGGGNDKLWNFDDLREGGMPDEWQKIGVRDLPEGYGILKISEPYAAGTIKKIDVTVQWKDRGEIRSITLSSLKTE